MTTPAATRTVVPAAHSAGAAADGTIRYQGCTFRAVDEQGSGGSLRDVFLARAPAYLGWYLREGDAARPSLAQARSAIATHMPELRPIYEDLCRTVVEGDPTASRMLSFWRPPASMVSCSQGVWREGDSGPLLVRNYDYAADLIDGIILRSAFRDRVVVGTTDGVWGLCDGMNDEGLAISLTFGGRAVVGEGFGMPLVIRYLLETCDDVQQAKSALERLPYSQAYNLTLTDPTSDVVTAYLGPDRAPSYRRLPVATNHQWALESSDPGLAASSLEREWWLLRLLDDPDVDGQRFSDWFLSAPLYSYAHPERVGTVYTASYEPRAGVVTHRWPGQDWVQTLDAFEEDERISTFVDLDVVPT